MLTVGGCLVPGTVPASLAALEDALQRNAPKEELVLRLAELKATIGPPRSCSECGVMFHPKRSDQVFCSKRCGARFGNRRARSEQRAVRPIHRRRRETQ